MNSIQTTPQTLNRYAYCLNNPLRYIDPTGEYSWDQTLDWTTGTFNNIFPSWQSWTGSSIYSGINSYFTSFEATLTSNSQYWIWNGSVSTISQITQTLCFDWLNFGKDFPGISQNIQQGNYLSAGLGILGETGRGLFIAGGTAKLLGADRLGSFWRYTGPESRSLEESRWVVRGRTAPYGTDFSTAMNRLSSPIEWNLVEKVDIPWYQYVAGPRPTASKWGFSGCGAEYRIGGFNNWKEYFTDWIKYFFGN